MVAFFQLGRIFQKSPDFISEQENPKSDNINPAIQPIQSDGRDKKESCQYGQNGQKLNVITV